MGVDQARHEDHAAGVDAFPGAPGERPLLVGSDGDGGDRAILDQHAAGLEPVARLDAAEPRVADVEAHAVSEGYQWRLPASAWRRSQPARMRTARLAVRTACSMPPYTNWSVIRLAIAVQTAPARSP